MLLYFRPLKKGTLDAGAAPPEVLSDLVHGRPVALRRLVPADDEERAAAVLQAIRRQALTNLEERGLETLYLTMGIATWPATDEGRPPEAPVLLVPLKVETRGRDDRNLTLQRSGDIQLNLVLLHALSGLGCELEADDVLAKEDPEEVESFQPDEVFAAIEAAAASVRGFRIERGRAVVGNFSFQKLAMVHDLRERAVEMAGHELIAALVGDLQARQALLGARSLPDPREFDRRPPDQEFLVLDADSSQQRVTEAVLVGQDGVIQGPPGTGKSQTIANLIASLAAQGKRVLFVAEKRAALEVVLERLNHVGLGHLVLDLHGADVSKREILARVKQSLEAIRTAQAPDTRDVHGTFSRRRERLAHHARRMHDPRPPSRLGVFELQARVLRSPERVRATSVRWRGDALDRLDPGTIARLRDLLAEAGGQASLFTRTDPSPWTQAALLDGSAAETAVDAVGRLLHEHLPALRGQLESACAAVRLPMIDSPTGAADVVTILGYLRSHVERYVPAIHEENVEEIADALEPALRGRLRAFLAFLVSSRYRAALRRMRGLRRVAPLTAGAAAVDARKIAKFMRLWRSRAGEDVLPRDYAGLEDLRRAHKEAATELAALESLLANVPLFGKRFEDLAALLATLHTDAATARRIPRVRAIEQALEAAGASAVTAEIRKRGVAPDLWPALLDHAWFASCLERVQKEEPELAAFDGRTHDGVVAEFCELDQDRLQLAAERVRRAHAERVIAAMNEHPEQDALVRREAEKKARHLPLRKLLREAPDVLTAVCPCWMASPLSVSQLLDADRRYFDVVMFDEASQVLPEDAVPAILRGSRVVVAGDRHQLPPTMFFVSGDDSEDEAVDAEPLPTEGFESLLDLMSAFLTPWPLEWHYRSRDERLIAFSNRHIYKDGLVTLPGTGGPPVVSHVLVAHVPGRDGDEDSASAEVRRVVEIVLDHAERRPQETLGVIAMGLKHANRIEAALDVALRGRADLRPFFDPSRKERFFVKSIERVQGDERDSIVLSVGYGKDRSGRLPFRFGPILHEGGERRLNVAVTRARGRMTVVSSFGYEDMDPERCRSEGTKLLRLYLQYAASEGRLLGDRGDDRSWPLNSFECDIYDALTARGIPLLSQWGSSRYRIDLVAKHPSDPGRLVLAIECDGATYHAAPTARDRDRLRQQHLEALGWRFLRIWSTDWFQRRESEITRAVRAYEEAVAAADRARATAAVQQAESPHAASAPLPERETCSTEAESAPAPTNRSPRPLMGRRKSIEDYTDRELEEMVRWILSDGLLRPNEDIVREVAAELGFQRIGVRIRATIVAAIEGMQGRQR